MKNYSKVISTLKYVLLMAVFIYSATSKAQTKPATKPLPSIKIVTPNDSLQYTLGAYLGAWITNNGFMVTNPDVFKKGVDDVLLNKTLLIDAASITPKLDGYQKRVISQRSAQQERLLFENIKGKEGVGALPLVWHI
jgi:hypothetical protein